MSKNLTNIDNNHYVYLLIDPRNNEVFYVGQGVNSRVNQHQQEAKKSDKETDKINRIKDILDAGYEVKKFIYSSNNTKDEAFDKEEELINFYRTIYPGQLTNIQSGRKSKHTMTPEELADITTNYEMVDFGDEKIMLIKQNHSWDYSNNDQDRYNAFRGDWKVDKSKIYKVDLICIVYDGIIQYVCKPKKWIPKYTDSNGVYYDKKNKNPRFEFEGQIIKGHKYCKKSIIGYKKIIKDKNGNISYKNIFGNAGVIGYINM